MNLFTWCTSASLLASMASATLLRGRTGFSSTTQIPRCRVTGRVFDLQDERRLSLIQHRSLPKHVVIETPKPVVAGLRAAIQNASAGSFSRQPRVTFIAFDDDSNIDRSPHGVPVLRSMFQAAIEEFPEADTYTYFNSDIAVDSSFVTTADAVVAAAETGTLRPRFLVVGRRTNVNWEPAEAESTELVDSDSFLQEFERGKLFRIDAEDYFMVSAKTWSWAGVPPFIVGHRGFDNWLVSEAALREGVDLVEATSTLRAMHMTDERIGNHEGFKKSADGADYNMDLLGGSGGFQNLSWVCGTTDGAAFSTAFNEANEVKFVKRSSPCHW